MLNNLEFDHADIFPDLPSIQRQFHHVVRTVPQSGCVITPDEKSLREVIDMGLWSRLQWLSGDKSVIQMIDSNVDQSQFTLAIRKSAVEKNESVVQATVNWQLCGEHNLFNAIAAVAASREVGVSLNTACAALNEFVNTKRYSQIR